MHTVVPLNSWSSSYATAKCLVLLLVYLWSQHEGKPYSNVCTSEVSARRRFCLQAGKQTPRQKPDEPAGLLSLDRATTYPSYKITSRVNTRTCSTLRGLSSSAIGFVSLSVVSFVSEMRRLYHKLAFHVYAITVNYVDQNLSRFNAGRRRLWFRLVHLG